MAETNIRYRSAVLRALQRQVAEILEREYQLDLNASQKILAGYFDDQQFPLWFYFANSPSEMARHVFIITRLLNANVDELFHVSDDARVITYLINVGRDFPGRLERIIAQNSMMRIASFNSETTLNGVRIVSLERATAEPARFAPEWAAEAEALQRSLRRYAAARGIGEVEQFLGSLSARYIAEEVQSNAASGRTERHLELFGRALRSGGPIFEVAELKYEDELGRSESAFRLTVAVANPGPRFIPELLCLVERRGRNIRRSYYDAFPHAGGCVGILSLYFEHAFDSAELTAAIAGLNNRARPPTEAAATAAEARIEAILRRLAKGAAAADKTAALSELRALCAANGPDGSGPESGSFYLNCVTDFLEAAKLTGLDRSEPALSLLLGYEAFDEFFVTAKANGQGRNVPGYRIKHSAVRGPAKGGLRIDPIVRFDEVAALSFMMTWKCARSRILFGGAKGGLMLNPQIFEGTALDYFDTLSSFGRSLFLVSGPLRDVPAGDVGCGPKEIGYLFEGFKSALRDLVMMAYGLKFGVSLIGDRIVSLEEARRLLAGHFGIDWTDTDLLRELASSEEYLELVAAAHVTGKPKRGIAARGAATGLGMVYATLAAVGNLYLDGRWPTEKPLEPDQRELLERAVALDEAAILAAESAPAYAADPSMTSLHGRLLDDASWERLEREIYPALLRGKTMVVQGSGKVGGAFVECFAPFGVKLIAMADSGGAVIGEDLDPADLLAAVENSREHVDRAQRASVVHAKANIRERLYGPEAARRVLELECDILVPAALENAVTDENAGRVRARIEVCGANGPNTSRAESRLAAAGTVVLYDFLANGAGVTASYFEWLRNWSDRLRYEAEHIRRRPFDPRRMDRYIMPEFRARIQRILDRPEDAAATRAWNLLLRDMMFAGVNEDWRYARARGVSLKQAGFVNAQYRVLAAALTRLPEPERTTLERSLPPSALADLAPFLAHPENRRLGADQD